MRKITNKKNLPEGLYNAIVNDPYNSGDCDYSTTRLLKPPRVVALERLHEDEIEEDASDRIWSLLGQAAHAIAERGNKSAVVETRYFHNFDGITISGAIDVFDRGTLSDYKVTSVYKVKDALPEEFEQQLNINAYLMKMNGLVVNRAEIIAILRDWSKLEAARDPQYPQSQVLCLDVPLWTHSAALRFIEERIMIHEKAKETLPECTPEERWAKPDLWAIKKAGTQKAINGGIYSDEAFAKRNCLPGHLIEHRPGKNTRCENYCSVSGYCSQFKALKGD